mgnify:CR=1 FL=1
MTIAGFLSLLVAVSWAQLGDQPRISTSNGHLSFETGNYKNIEFKSGSGKVLINGNDFDLLQTQVDGHTQ